MSYIGIVLRIKDVFGATSSNKSLSNSSHCFFVTFISAFALNMLGVRRLGDGARVQGWGCTLSITVLPSVQATEAFTEPAQLLYQTLTSNNRPSCLLGWSRICNTWRQRQKVLSSRWKLIQLHILDRSYGAKWSCCLTGYWKPAGYF